MACFLSMEFARKKLPLIKILRKHHIFNDDSRHSRDPWVRGLSTFIKYWQLKKASLVWCLRRVGLIPSSRAEGKTTEEYFFVRSLVARCGCSTVERLFF